MTPFRVAFLARAPQRGHIDTSRKTSHKLRQFFLAGVEFFKQFLVDYHFSPFDLLNDRARAGFAPRLRGYRKIISCPFQPQPTHSSAWACSISAASSRSNSA